VGFDPAAIQSQKTELRCPCCDRWMVSRIVGGLEIQECESCHGLWAPEARFDSLVDRAAKLARERMATGEVRAPRVHGGNPASTKVEYRRCPECSALMRRRNFKKRSGVIIDQCHTHGTWLDAHELERIAGFVLSGRAEQADRAVEREKADQEREAARSASLRMSMSKSMAAAEQGKSSSIFSSRKQTGAVGTIFDLLQSFLT
jgi:Zn-finger nucleic acid-binding protein